MPFQPAPRVNARVTSDGVVLLDTTNGAIFTANAVGATIWSRLSSGTHTSDIADSIAASYNVPSDLVLADVERFVHTLVDRGLVIPIGETSQRLSTRLSDSDNTAPHEEAGRGATV